MKGIKSWVPCGRELSHSEWLFLEGLGDHQRESFREEMTQRKNWFGVDTEKENDAA